MTVMVPTNNSMRKTLASQLDRMDQMLDGLSEGLNEAVAAAVQAAVGQAVRSAVQEALREVLASPELRQRLAPGGGAAALPAAPRQPDRPPAPPNGGGGGAVGRAWSWVRGAAWAVYRPTAHAARQAWRAAAALPGMLWRWRAPLAAALTAGAAAILAPFAGPPVMSALGRLAGSALALCREALGLLG
jgi:hypothetical protein